MFSNAKVSGRVFDKMIRQWGIIDKIDLCDVYQINVKFENTIITKTYTLKGMSETTHAEPSLLLDEIPFFIPPKRPLPDLPIDTKLFV